MWGCYLRLRTLLLAKHSAAPKEQMAGTQRARKGAAPLSSPEVAARGGGEAQWRAETNQASVRSVLNRGILGFPAEMSCLSLQIRAGRRPARRPEAGPARGHL